MQGSIAFALLALAAFTSLSQISAQVPANRTAPVPTPTPSPSALRTADFVAAGITRPGALVRQVQSGTSPPVSGPGQVTCQFDLLGDGLKRPLDVASLDPASQATGLQNASITCTGAETEAVIIQGGQALQAFTANFSGWRRFRAIDHFLQITLLALLFSAYTWMITSSSIDPAQTLAVLISATQPDLLHDLDIFCFR